MSYGNPTTLYMCALRMTAKVRAHHLRTHTYTYKRSRWN